MYLPAKGFVQAEIEGRAGAQRIEKPTLAGIEFSALDPPPASYYVDGGGAWRVDLRSDEGEPYEPLEHTSALPWVRALFSLSVVVDEGGPGWCAAANPALVHPGMVFIMDVGGGKRHTGLDGGAKCSIRL